MRGRVQAHQTIITAQRPFIFSVQTMQSGLDEIDDRLVRSFASHPRNFGARSLFLAAPEINEDPQHTRIRNERIKRECFFKSRVCALEIFRAAQPFENAIDVTRAESIMRERELGIELDCALEMSDGRVRIF